MDVSELALFKFKCLEGVLEHWRAYDMESSLYENRGRRVLVTFDIKNKTADILDDDKVIPNVKLFNLLDKLDSLGLVEERIVNRHLNSYLPFNKELLK